MRVPADANLDELKKKARQRLVGAVVLALAAAVFVPMLLESDERPLGDDVSVRIPPVDQGKFVNGINASSQGNEQAGTTKAGSAKSDADKAGTGKAADPSQTSGKSGTTSKARDGKADDKAVTGDNNDASAPANNPAIAANDAPTAAKDAPTAAARAPARSLDAAEQRVLGGPRNGAGTTSVSSTVTAKPELAPAAANKAAAPKSAASTAASTPARAGFVVQLAAFSDDKGANALANRLKRSGHPAFTEPVTTSRGTLWRVRVGPYPSREDANAARDKLKREGQNGIVAARTS